MAETPTIDTYKNVTTENGNPFVNAEGVDSYGGSANLYHAIMTTYYGSTPVTTDFDLLQSEIGLVFVENGVIWDALKRTLPIPFNPLQPYTENETIRHTGTDTTANGGDSTDKRNTFDNGALRDVGKVETSNTGSITYGHTISTEKTRYAGTPLEQIDKYRSLATEVNLTDIIIKTVIRAITHHIYIPRKPSNG